MDPDAYPRAAEPEGRMPDVPLEVFWEILDQVPEALRPAYITLVVTGMGPGEYCRVEATDLHPLTFSLTVHGTKLGRQGGQLISVAEEAWPWVEAAVPAPISQDGLSRTWKAACRAAGHSGLRLYDLRHAHAQWLSDAGVSEALIGVSLRHKTAAMTRRYTKRLAKRETAERLGRVIFPGKPRDSSRDGKSAASGGAA
jgi:integrase